MSNATVVRYPEPVQRQSMRMWEDQADLILSQQVVTLIQEVFLQPDEAQRDQPAVAAAYETIHRYLAQLDAQLAHTAYVCGRFSVADIATFIAIGFSQTLGVVIPPTLTALLAWHERMLARDAISSDFTQMMQAVAAA